MKPTDVLREEHEAVISMLAVLDNIVQRIREGKDINTKHAEEIADFIRNFVDRCHHAKEEDSLFPAMEKAGLLAHGPIGIMLAEHDMGRDYVRKMSLLIAKDRLKDKHSLSEFAASAKGYSALLRSHIEKENNILFPLAESIIGKEKKLELAVEFENIEANRMGSGVHDKYHEMLDHLAEVYA